MEDNTKKPWQLTKDEYIKSLGEINALEDYQDQSVDNLRDYIKIENFDKPIFSKDIYGEKVDFRRYKKQHIDEESFKNLGIAAFIGKDSVGWIDSVTKNKIETIVAKEYQGMGIGTILMYIFRKIYPFYPSGGYTEAGLKTTEKVHRMFVLDALNRGEDVPENVLADYGISKSPDGEIKTASWFGSVTRKDLYGDEVVEPPSASDSVKEKSPEDGYSDELNDILPILLERFKMRREPHDLERLEKTLIQLERSHLYDKALDALVKNNRNFKKMQYNHPKRGRGRGR